MCVCVCVCVCVFNLQISVIKEIQSEFKFVRLVQLTSLKSLNSSSKTCTRGISRSEFLLLKNNLNTKCDVVSWI